MIASARTLSPDARQPVPSPVGGPYPMGLMALLTTVGMLFAAFTAALLVRRTGGDWTPVRLPRVVVFSTTCIVLSSIAVEVARAWLRRGMLADSVNWLAGSGLLGMLFLGGQVVAWRHLALRGVFLPSSPHAAFFYMLSATHAAHIVGGLGAIAWTLNRLRRGAYSPERHAGFTHAAVFWHFVGAVWLYLLILLIAF
ncbi:MAG: hypothetical protein EXR93_12090 [Gemmatimonadetes bacterium]|nr:hypothetical protein [Gemmatimonadota bacterium]